MSPILPEGQSCSIGALSDNAPVQYQEELGRLKGCSGKDYYPWDIKATEYQRQISNSSIASLATELGVSQESLRRLGIGFDQHSYTFPMKDSRGKVIGIRQRPKKDSSSKLTAKGSKVGLFIPEGVTDAMSPLICEGESDTAAGLTLDYPSIGKPFAAFSPDMIVEFMRDCPVACPCIVGDNDPSGIKHAKALGEALRLAGITCRVLFPPEDCKDLRQWLQLGLTHEELVQAIHNQPILWPDDWPQGFVQVPNALMRNGFVAKYGGKKNGGNMFALAVLIKSYEGLRKPFPKVEDLAELLNVETSTVHRYKKKLKKLGVLTWRRGHTGRANEYTVNLGPERWEHREKRKRKST